MAFLKGIQIDTLKEALDAGVKVAQDSVTSINVGEFAQNAKDAVTAGIDNFDLNEAVQGAKEAVASGAEKASDAISNALRNDSGDEEVSSAKELVALLWCLAYVDGAITEEERSVLAQLSHELDENYNAYAGEIEQEYISRLENASKEFGQDNAPKVEAMRIIESMELSTLDAKLLCWNLLALASSDELDEKELSFIRYVAEKTGVESGVFKELCNHNAALLETEKSIEQLKLSGKSYEQIDPLVQEATLRQQNIIAAIQALVSDR